jgi:hypothetical protein
MAHIIVHQIAPVVARPSSEGAEQCAKRYIAQRRIDNWTIGKSAGVRGNRELRRSSNIGDRFDLSA